MDVVLVAASYSRGYFSPCLAGSVMLVMVPGVSTFHLEPGTIIILDRHALSKENETKKKKMK